MPVIMIHTLELLEEQKRVIAQKYTDLLAELTKVPQERIYVFFYGYPLDGIAAGGMLNSEIPPSVLKQFVTKYTAELAKAARVTIISRLMAKKRQKQKEAARQALLELATNAREEPGCLNFDALQCADPDFCFMLHETWADETARKAYLDQDYYWRFAKKVPGLFKAAKGEEALEVLTAVPYTGPDTLPSPGIIITRMTAREGRTHRAHGRQPQRVGLLPIQHVPRSQQSCRLCGGRNLGRP
jgi:quinol monooxygenase YgiN/phenylpyruvate tautomerase PptA (4-oxalocrotonate tautomerase family)